MPNHQIPFLAENIPHIALKVVSRPVAWQQVATPSVMAKCGKRISNYSRKFTRYQDSHIRLKKLPARAGQKPKQQVWGKTAARERAKMF